VTGRYPARLAAEPERGGDSVETTERYNSATNRFCCDDRYIRIGMPSSP